MLYAIREVVINISEIPSGLFADNFGRKKSLVGSFVIYIFSFIIYFLANDFWPFVPAFVLYGIADAFRTGTHKGMIMDYLKMNGWQDQKINYYGHTRGWSQKGSAVSSLIAGLLVFYSGSYQYIFLFSIAPYLLNFFLVLSYPKELDRMNKQDKSLNSKEFNVSIKSLFKVLKQPNVFRIINNSALHSAYLKSVKDYIQPLMVQVAVLIPILSATEIEKKNGIIIGLFYTIIYLLTSKASKMAQFAHSKSRNIAYLTLQVGFFAGILSGVFYAFDYWLVSLIAFVGIYLIENLRKPILTGYIADNVPGPILASVISAESQLETVITAIIALIFGIVADYAGIGASFIIVSFLLNLLSFFLNFFDKQKTNYQTIT